MTDIDPTEAGKRFQEALAAPRPERSIEEWEDDVGVGWRPLIRGLDVNLRDLDPNYRIGQVKEKFGGLRYYVSTSSDLSAAKREEFDQLIREAEDLSFKICYECGAPGKCEAIKYWVQTLCPRCRRKSAQR